MVVILILPSSSSSIHGCDGFATDPDNQQLNATNNNNNNIQSSSNHRISTNNLNINNKKHHSNKHNDTKNFIRHVTRINISDIYSQVEFDGDTEPVTKEGMYNLYIKFNFPLVLCIYANVAFKAMKICYT